MASALTPARGLLRVCQILKEFALKTEIQQKDSYEDNIGLPKYTVTTIMHYHAPSMVR